MGDYFDNPNGGGGPAGQATPGPAGTPLPNVPEIRQFHPDAQPETPGISRFPSYPSTPRNPAPPMRIRRLPSLQDATSGPIRPTTSAANVGPSRSPGPSADADGRRRSFSDPQRTLSVPESNRPNLREQASTASGLPTIQEARNTFELQNSDRPNLSATPAPPPTRGRLRSISNAARGVFGGGRDRGNSTASRRSNGSKELDPTRDAYEAEVVDYLDVVDPEVSTLTTLNNVQNSLFVPYLGRFYNRQPTYELSAPDDDDREAVELAEERIHKEYTAQRPTPIEEDKREDSSESPSLQDAEPSDSHDPRSSLARMSTIKSTMSGTSASHNWAVLPHGVRLEGWTEQEKDELNDHVRHALHSRRSAFKRSMRAFGKYVRKPMGFLVTFYAFTITFWGAAWVIFLIGWINVGDNKEFWVDICDQILTALLVVIGISLLPWRLADTYHMVYIAHYHYKIWRLRQERGLPQLPDMNDLPDTDPKNKPTQYRDDEEAVIGMKRAQRPPAVRHDSVVLEPREMRILRRHQTMFAKSHTFYKPHETATHRAFSIKLLITVVVLLDFHSFFQIALASTTWAIDYRVRGRVTTTVILAFSLSCNIMGGIIISIGDKRSRKKEVFERIFRQARTEEAMKKIEKKSGRPRLGVRPSVQKLDKVVDLEAVKRQEALRKEVESAEVEDASRISKSAGVL